MLLDQFHEHRALLFSIAYRMLGSVADAEDILQDAFLRWQKAADDDVRSPRAYLVTIVSRLCINQLQSARVQREEYVGQWLPEPVLSEAPSADAALVLEDSLSMAVLVLLERLNPTERAVYLLREAFGHDFAEIGRILGKSEVNCRQIHKRSRDRVAEGRPRFEASPAVRQRIVEEFLAAIGGEKMDSLMALLAPDVSFQSDGGGVASAVPQMVTGAERVARLILGAVRKLVPAGLERRFAWVNGQPGIIGYLNGQPYNVFTADIADGRVQRIYIVSNPSKLTRLPPLPQSA